MKKEVRTEDWPNRQRKYEISYANGQKHGLEKWWYSNGKRKHEIPHTNGQRHGLVKSWYDNGKKYIETHYVHGQRHGLVKWCQYNGSFFILEKWHQDQRVWGILFPSTEQIPADAEIELFFHPIPELK